MLLHSFLSFLSFSSLNTVSYLPAYLASACCARDSLSVWQFYFRSLIIVIDYNQLIIVIYYYQRSTIVWTKLSEECYTYKRFESKNDLVLETKESLHFRYPMPLYFSVYSYIDTGILAANTVNCVQRELATKRKRGTEWDHERQRQSARDRARERRREEEEER